MVIANLVARRRSGATGTTAADKDSVSNHLRHIEQTDAKPVANEKARNPDNCSCREAPPGNQVKNWPRMEETQGQQAGSDKRKEDDQRMGEHAITERSLIGVKPETYAACRHQAEPPSQEMRRYRNLFL